GAGGLTALKEPSLGPARATARIVVAVQFADATGRERPRFPIIQLDRARRLALHPSRRHRSRAALFCRRAAGSDARRPHPDGRRRAFPAGRRRNGRAAPGALPHLGLLSPDRGDRERCSRPCRHRRRNGASHHIRTPGPRHRQGRRRPCHGTQEAGGIFLMAAGEPDLLHFITCGSVDDGKSTLIGRLLHDTSAVLDDQLATLEADSAKVGTQGEALDFALLVDGLSAEREQGITIDVAYRYFGTGRRKFIVADCPGHEQYTRNMATGASTADLALVLVDARKGLVSQTRRHTYIASLFGIRHVVLAVNKMDLVDYGQSVFEDI